METLTATNPKCDHALALAEMGFCVHPVNGKRGILDNWPDVATTDREMIRGWWQNFPTANPAIVTGAVSGLTILDIDGEEGQRTLAELEAKHGPLPETPMVRTGGGGRHYYFHYQAGINNDTKFLPGLDVKNDRGSIVAPGSIHANGRSYEWLKHPADVPLALMPAWLADLMRAGAESNGHKAPLKIEGQIPDGRRGQTLFRLACSLRSKGLEALEIRAGLTAANARCVPPMPDKDLDGITKSACQYEVNVFDEAGKLIPLRVAEAICNEYPYLIFTTGAFWDFDGRVYVERDLHQLESRAITMAGTSARRSNLADAMRLLENLTWQSSAFFDEPQTDGAILIACQNGMLNVAMSDLLAHDPRFRCRNLLPVTYDATATYPRFQRFLIEVLPDDPAARELLQEWFGYSLIPDSSQEKAVVYIGEGGNGKGRVVRIQENLLGRVNVAGVALSALRSDRTFPTAALQGKLLNVLPEMELAHDIDEGWVKSLISGDTVEVERKGRDPFTMRNVARFVFATNNPPHINDRSNGVWRRLIPIRFPREFDEQEQDRNLDEKLLAELPGILNWSLEGLRRLSARGHFDLSDRIKAELEAYRRECNPLQAWREERLVDRPGARIPGETVYTDYRAWCNESGHEAMSRNRMTRELQRLGVATDRWCTAAGGVIRGFVGVWVEVR
ncbi:MAG: phage/plasmid primase, P4 family [Candidatus Sumerlaeota bacterium]|nr:phage/plasmid primase, P4 family [Candidatus Sumerlaeota bacterium]